MADIRSKITVIPDKNVVEVEEAIRSYLPIDTEESSDLIDKYTFEEWLGILADRNIQKLYSRGKDKLATEASQKINIYK